MAHTRCDRCRGQKTVLGLGSMTVTCAECHGVGYVSVDDAVLDTVGSDVVAADAVKRKYVRKSKSVSDE